VVDRSQPGQGGDRQRQSEVGRQVANQVIARERNEQAAHPLADEDVRSGGGVLGGRSKQPGVDLLAEFRRRQVR
jgi:hypothetical protein